MKEGEIIKLKKNFVQYIKKINLRITKVQTYFLIKKRERLLIPWQQRHTHWCIWLILKISKRGKLIQIQYFFFFSVCDIWNHGNYVVWWCRNLPCHIVFLAFKMSLGKWLKAKLGFALSSGMCVVGGFGELFLVVFNKACKCGLVLDWGLMLHWGYRN